MFGILISAALILLFSSRQLEAFSTHVTSCRNSSSFLSCSWEMDTCGSHKDLWNILVVVLLTNLVGDSFPVSDICSIIRPDEAVWPCDVENDAKPTIPKSKTCSWTKEHIQELWTTTLKENGDHDRRCEGWDKYYYLYIGIRRGWGEGR